MASPAPGADPRQRIARAIMALQQQAHAVGANALIEVNVAEAPGGGYVVEGDAVVLGDPSLHDLPPGPPPASTPVPGGWPTPVQQVVGGDDSGWG